MHKLIQLLILILCFGFISETYTYKNIQEDECIVLSSDDNDDIIDWDHTGRELTFTSKFTGTKNIYVLDLMNLKFTETTKGFHSASYLNEYIEKKEIYIPITSTKDTSHSSPIWSLNSNKILSIGEYQNTNEIFYTNRNTLKLVGTKIKDVICANWKNNYTFYYTKKEQPRKLYQKNIRNHKDSLLLEAKSNITGISNQKGKIYLTCKGGVLEYKPNRNTKEWYIMPVSGSTSWRLERLSFIVKSESGEARIHDLNNKVTHPLFIDEGDGSPSLSKNKKFVTFYSKFLNGIVLKRLKKKY